MKKTSQTVDTLGNAHALAQMGLQKNILTDGRQYGNLYGKKSELGGAKDKGTVYFNLAISHMFLKENSNAKEYFELASEEFKNDPEKIRLIKSLKP